jgi:hypothetical protein
VPAALLAAAVRGGSIIDDMARSITCHEASQIRHQACQLQAIGSQVSNRHRENTNPPKSLSDMRHEQTGSKSVIEHSCRQPAAASSQQPPGVASGMAAATAPSHGVASYREVVLRRVQQAPPTAAEAGRIVHAHECTCVST